MTNQLKRFHTSYEVIKASRVRSKEKKKKRSKCWFNWCRWEEFKNEHEWDPYRIFETTAWSYFWIRNWQLD